MRRVPITGAAGKIGGVLRNGLRGAYPVLRPSDFAPLDEPGPGEELNTAAVRSPLVKLGGAEIERIRRALEAARIGTEGALPEAA